MATNLSLVVNETFFDLLSPVPSTPLQVRKTPPAPPRPAPRHPRRTREHAQEIAQDYVEFIAELIAATGEARVIDLARRLGVTHVTVARTIQRLQREGLVTSPALPLDFSHREREQACRRNHAAATRSWSSFSDR